MVEAALEHDGFRGCVENGMETVKEVLTNWVCLPSLFNSKFNYCIPIITIIQNGREKCISCGVSAPRDQALAARPDPEEHPFLKDCKCPLSGAALELWMVKMTVDLEDIPQRGADDKLANHRLALNLDILKVIGGAIKVASGHDIDTLLTPEVERLEHTIPWALGHLYSMSSKDGSAYAESFSFFPRSSRKQWILCRRRSRFTNSLQF